MLQENPPQELYARILARIATLSVRRARLWLASAGLGTVLAFVACIVVIQQFVIEASSSSFFSFLRSAGDAIKNGAALKSVFLALIEAAPFAFIAGLIFIIGLVIVSVRVALRHIRPARIFIYG